MDNDVKNGIVQPGQYLVVEFDFSRIIRAPDMDESVEALVEEINHGLSRFMINYSKHLGDLFTSDISALKEGTPAGNLTRLIAEVDHALNHIHESGDKGHALWGVKGVCFMLLHTITHFNAYRSICLRMNTMLTPTSIWIHITQGRGPMPNLFKYSSRFGPASKRVGN